MSLATKKEAGIYKKTNKMKLLRIKRYQAKHPILKPLIKYFWVFRSDHKIIINHKLLPVGNIDLVLNFSSPIKYTSDNKNETVPNRFHFNGIRNRYCMINQVGKMNMIGISFFPPGLYPFFKTPLSLFTNKTIELDLLISEFTSRIEAKLSITDSILEKIDILEKELVPLVDYKLVPSEEIIKVIKVIKVFNTFYSNTNNLNINYFCARYGIDQRKLERIFKKYIGISPKLFHRLNRFQIVINKIVKNEYMNLTSLAYENEYYDQTHFIKDFKSFTGCSPSQFLNERRSIKENIEYIAYS